LLFTCISICETKADVFWHLEDSLEAIKEWEFEANSTQYPISTISKALSDKELLIYLPKVINEK